MNKATEDLFSKTLVYEIKGMSDVIIKKNLQYTNTENNELTMDIYYPKDVKNGKLSPAVVFVTGYPDPGFKAITGYKLKEVAQYISWSRLIAASGLVAITYTNNEPVTDVNTLLQYLIKNSVSLGIDKDRIGIFACSGNTPTALNLLMSEQRASIKCAVLCYGYMPDIEESTFTAEAAKQFHFVNPCSQLSINDFHQNTPLLIVRAGQDAMPNLKASIDRFIASALTWNLPISVINVPNASHAFDIMDNEKYSYEAIENILFFIKLNLATERL